MGKLTGIGRVDAAADAAAAVTAQPRRGRAAVPGPRAEPAGAPAGTGPEPVPARLVGREHESAALQALLSRRRLVTVTGPVGVGKSALATAALTARARATGTTVVHVRAPERSDALAGGQPAVPREVSAAARTLAAALGDEADADDACAALAATARRRRGGELLLLLDDVDAVHLTALRLVATLLARCPDVRVVVTARRPLGLGQERVLRLAPLAVHSAAGARPAPAVRLFLERAGLAADEPTLPTVTAICALLDGLPLAIGHAARRLARPDLSGPAELLARLRAHGQCALDDPDAELPRHRTLRHALAAVEELCEPRDRVVWFRAGIFAGAFTEEAAVALCEGGEVGPDEVPACLARLTAVGVLVPLGDPGGVRTPRLRMPRAAQDFARERLAAKGECAVARDRLEAHARRAAAAAANLWDCGAQSQAVELVQDELANLRAALRRRPDSPDHAETLLQLALDLWFWWIRHDPAEGRALLSTLLAHVPPNSQAAHRALWAAAWLGVGRNDAAASDRDLGGASAAALPGEGGAGVGRSGSGVGLFGAGAPESAGWGWDLGGAWAAAVLGDDRAGVGRIAFVEALGAWQRGDVAAAGELLQEAVELIPAYAPGGPSAATALAVLALVRAASAPARARRAAWRAISWAGQSGDGWACVLARHALAVADAHCGHPGRAAHRARRILAAQRPDLPTAPGTAALRRLATEPGLPDARDAIPLPPQPEPTDAGPAEQPGCLGGPMRTYRRK